jgi:hypothetical protein
MEATAENGETGLMQEGKKARTLEGKEEERPLRRRGEDEVEDTIFFSVLLLGEVRWGVWSRIFRFSQLKTVTFFISNNLLLRGQLFSLLSRQTTISFCNQRLANYFFSNSRYKF